MILEERMCWIFLFATLVTLFYHQKMILQHLKEVTDFTINCVLNSNFRIERVLQDKKGIIIHSFERDGVKYEILERKVEESERHE